MRALLLLSSAVLLLSAGVLATAPNCPNSAGDLNGHYTYTASPACYITTAASPNLATQSWTASLWINPTIQTVTGFNPIIGQGGAGGCGGAGMACTNNLMIAYSFD